MTREEKLSLEYAWRTLLECKEELETLGLSCVCREAIETIENELQELNDKLDNEE